jgi:HEAT repeat protein
VGDRLGRIGAPAVEPLIEVLLHPNHGDQSWRAQRGAAYALGRIGDRRAVEALVHVLGSPAGWDEEAVVGAVVRALGDIGDARAVGPLISALATGEGQIRHGVGEALAGIDDPSIVPSLVEALQDSRLSEGALVALRYQKSLPPEAEQALKEYEERPERWSPRSGKVEGKW